jgi:hypothetical protein
MIQIKICKDILKFKSSKNLMTNDIDLSKHFSLSTFNNKFKQRNKNIVEKNRIIHIYTFTFTKHNNKTKLIETCKERTELHNITLTLWTSIH